MKTLSKLLPVLILSISCIHNENSVIEIPQLSYENGEIIIDKWNILGPFPMDSTQASFPDMNHLADFNLSENSITYDEFCSIPEHSVFKNLPGLKFIHYNVQKDYVELNEELNDNHIATSYAACLINSETEQDVALLSGSNDGIKIWVNNQFCYKNFTNKILRKNDNIVKVRLKKGRNFILLKLYNNTPDWQFHFCISSRNYIRKHMLYSGYELFTGKYNLNYEDSMHLNIDPVMIQTDSLFQLKLFNKQDDLLFMCDVDPLNQRVSLNNLPQGAYRCVLTTNDFQFDQAITYGVFNDIFGINTNSILEWVLKMDRFSFGEKMLAEINQRFALTEKELANLRVLFLRLDKLYQYQSVQGKTAELERKIADIYFKLVKISDAVTNHREPFKHVTGLHLRSYISKIDGTHEYYMVYIPETYKRDKKLPLIVFMPFVEGKHHPFYYSWHIAKNDKLDYLKSLSDEHGMAFLITSSRFYNRYNLNPIISESTIEAILEVQNDYAIDHEKIYLYGDCSGGLNALLTACRHSSVFAATCVIGPDLSYIHGNDINIKDIPNEWITKNNLVSHAVNFKNMPIKIIQSKNDEKSDYAVSKMLTDQINKAGGQAILDNELNPTKTKKLSLITDNINYYKAYEFFKGKTLNKVGPVHISTHELKYGSQHWLSIKEKLTDERAGITGSINGQDIIIHSENASRIILNLSDMNPKKEQRRIFINDKLIYAGVETYLELTTDNTLMDNENLVRKNHLTEGPVHHIFSKNFLVVRGTKGSLIEKQIADSIFNEFMNNWKVNYFEPCRFKDDTEVTNEDRMKYNLVLCGSPNSNSVLESISNALPFELNENFIKVKGEIINGNHLFLKMIYPNPLNREKYVLVLAGNGLNFRKSHIHDLSYKGWYDYEVCSFQKNALVKGNFTIHWQ